MPGWAKRTLLGAGLIVLAGLLLFLFLDGLFPVDLSGGSPARVIVASDGSPLRSFSDDNGLRRQPITVDQVSERYLEALIGYEDRWFYYHPGVNPLSLVRALYQWLKNGKIISGGSTLTMQVARLTRPSPRTVPGKLIQIFTALQLEMAFTKKEILNYYLNHAPFGGVLEGVQAASHAYFDHGAESLTHAEAALLAVMPQAPTRFRPDLHPKAARLARDKLLARLAEFGIWSHQVVNAAKKERVIGWPVEHPMRTPLLARRLDGQTNETITRIDTFIDFHLQLGLEQLARDYAANLPPHVSTAILVMNNRTGGVEAYVGSADFFNLSRFAHVDMVLGMRSPGSTLKPFLYGLALDQGLIHSQSLLMDVPIDFDGFRPTNFNGSFNGPVSAASALSRSLNLPAVQLLDHLAPRFVYARLVNAGFTMEFPHGTGPNLAMALGGFATNLESLVQLYSALAREGTSITPRYTKEDGIEQHRLLSPGAAWIVHDMLLPDTAGPVSVENPHLAMKTGTSYGFRDAWALGVDKGYTVGVWVGRPDGVPVPGFYGANTATPLLQATVRLLPRHYQPLQRPDSVTMATTCWPGGQRLSAGNGEHCEETKSGWLLDETAPPTLTRRRALLFPPVTRLNLRLSEDRRYRVPQDCKPDLATLSERVILWPRMLESWLPPERRRVAKIPPVLPQCSTTSSPLIGEEVDIKGMTDNDSIMRKDKSDGYPGIDLRVVGGNGPWYWFENAVLQARGKSYRFAPKHPGVYQILVVEQSGALDRLEVKVY